MHNSAVSDMDYRSDSLASGLQITGSQSSAEKQTQEILDLRAVEATSKLDAGFDAVDRLAAHGHPLEKKKLLAHLTGINQDSSSTNKDFDVSSQAHHENWKKTLIAQSNPSRPCRFCGREFPSGRALGGHMRVHGALLDAQFGNIKHERQTLQDESEQNITKKGERLRSHGCDGAVAHVSALRRLDFREDLSERAVSQENSDRSRVVGNYVLMSSLHQKLDGDRMKQKNQETGGNKILGGSCMNHHGAQDDFSKLRDDRKQNQETVSKANQLATQSETPLNGVCDNWNTELRPTSTSEEEMMWRHVRQQMKNTETAHPCSECGKAFPSWKALFGHMRCHPEREWRGIQCPVGPELDRTSKTVARRSSATAELYQARLDPGDIDNMSSCLKIDAKEEAIDIKSESAHIKKQNQDSLIREDGDDDSPDMGLPEAQLCQELRLLSEETPANWTPVWSAARKRSKRRRTSLAHWERASAVNATSDDMKSEEKPCNIGDHEEDLINVATCLVLLSTAGENMHEGASKSNVHSAEESSLGHPNRARRAFGNAGIKQTRVYEGYLENEIRNYNFNGLYDDDDGDDNYGNDDDANNDMSDANDDELGGTEEAANHAESNEGHVESLLTVKFQCSTCKKCFNSHQALGGHRASHRKMKGCFARTKSSFVYDTHESSEENINWNVDKLHIGLQKHRQLKEQKVRPLDKEGVKLARNGTGDPMERSLKKKFKGHECSICHRVFVTGQALGGHKRCHWTGERLPLAVAGADAASVTSNSMDQNTKQQASLIKDRDEQRLSSKSKTKDEILDLNLPAPMEEEEEEKEEEEEDDGDEEDEEENSDVGGFITTACGPPSMNGARLVTLPTIWKHEWNPTNAAHIQKQLADEHSMQIAA